MNKLLFLILGFIGLNKVINTIITEENYAPVKNINKLTNNLISMLSLFVYLETGNLEILLSYYIYDLIQVLFAKNGVYFIHHLASIFMIILPSDHVDYLKIQKAIHLMKVGDLFIYQYKIIDNSWLPYLYPNTSTLLQEFFLGVSVIFWMYYRIYRPINLYPFEDGLIYFMCVGFHIVNIVWCFKMLSLLPTIQKNNYYKNILYKQEAIQ